MNQKRDIKSLDKGGLGDLCQKLGVPMFRVKQLWQWLYQKGASSFGEMTNLPKPLRAELSSEYRIGLPSVAARQCSADGTRKYLFSLPDGTMVESVGIPSRDNSRLTVCFSTQAGCAMGCVFCATGLNGFKRNLTFSEMYDQVRLVGLDFSMRVSNVVAMGQGEPFNNYDEVLSALRMMNDPNLLGIGARHITVSTCGVIEGIRRFSTEGEQFTLAISLHSAIQDTRDRIMPGIKTAPLSRLKAELQHYIEATGRRPTLEYVMIRDLNDDEEHLEALVVFCADMLCHVNLIPLNPVKDKTDEPGALFPSDNLDYFEGSLMRRGIETSIRASRGVDIDGACGQLRQKYSYRETQAERNDQPFISS